MLELERRRLPDGSSIAAAIDYSLNAWAALTRPLDDGPVPIDNSFIQRQIKPWAMGLASTICCRTAGTGPTHGRCQAPTLPFGQG